MAYSARTIADWFIARAATEGEYLTQMQLQKLVYVAHGWHLALRGSPLVGEPIEAWRWGPVFRSLYRDFADFGSSRITPITIRSPSLDGETAAFLEKVWQAYRRFDAIELSSMTHADGTPWSQSYRDTYPPKIIPNDLIGQHYRELVATRR